MIERPRLPEVLWTQLLWVLAASVAWALLVMERVLELHEGPPRTTLIVIGYVFIAGSASWAARRLRHSRARYLPLLLIAGILGREWQRHALREQYRASAPVKSIGLTESLFHPVTTLDVALHYYALTSKGLELPRLRIVSLTDLHVTPALPEAYFEHLFELTAAQDPDLILLTGDYVSEPENIELIARLFARRFPARFGAFAVLGNHDLWTDPARIRQVLAAGGVALVEGRCQHLPSGVGRIAICGTDAPWGPELSESLDRTELNLVLSHTPDNVYRLAEQGASLVFSGHTHGGQMRVPGLGALVVPSRFGRLFDAGHFQVAGAELFVSAGVGAGMPPLRIYCQPEILIVDITRE
ncbi:MAG TPA: metallophosphoesterase [Polyangiaceae bacterium]